MIEWTVNFYYVILSLVVIIMWTSAWNILENIVDHCIEGVSKVGQKLVIWSSILSMSIILMLVSHNTLLDHSSIYSNQSVDEHI
jgi:hypothetical protein